jgi:hypothetical protein
MDDAAFQELEAEFSTTLATLSADPALATFKREYEKLHEALVRVTDTTRSALLCDEIRYNATHPRSSCSWSSQPILFLQLLHDEFDNDANTRTHSSSTCGVRVHVGCDGGTLSQSCVRVVAHLLFSCV